MSDQVSDIDTHQRAMRVLRAALDVEAPRRGHVIEELCAGDEALRCDVHSLLDSHDRAGGFLETPAVWPGLDAAAQEADSAALLIGRRVGRYTIRGLLGRGGMGAVFLAEQDEPQREVALKILPMSMLALSRDALRRFRREARVLARLQHAGIASIYEAGTHDDGSGATPFFAMEHVGNARTITAYAREAALPLEERLHLFLQACDAVHFGHQRGVIHRDLKPANMLVNARGEVKIIDFGIARLMADDDATESGATQTVTGAGRPIGTPAYMSPEQFTGDGRDLDVRTDVFALGVVLSELLSGADGSISDDLRTIVGKATSQERERRYQSVADLARDVRRFMSDQPIDARPPSALYHLRLFARRNAGLVASLALAAILLAAGATVSTILAIGQARARAKAERQATIANETVAFLNNDLLAAADPYFSPNPNVTVREVVDAASQRLEGRFRDEPLIEAAVQLMLGRIYVNLGRYDDAQPHLERALALRRQTLGIDDAQSLEALHQMAWLRYHQCRYDLAEPLLVEAIERRSALLGPEHPDTLESRHVLASVWLRMGRVAQARDLLQEVLESRQRTLPPDAPEQLQSLDGMARSFMVEGRFAEALPLYEEIHKSARSRWGEDHRFTIYTAGNLGRVCMKLGRNAQAIDLLSGALGGAERLLGPEHPDTLVYQGDLATVYANIGRLDEAVPLCEQALEGSRAVNGEDHSCTINCMTSLGLVRKSQGRFDEAEELLRQAIDISSAAQGPEHPDTLLALDSLALVLDARGRREEAEETFRAALEARQRTLGPRHPDTLTSRHNLAYTLGNLQRYDEAEALFREVIQQRREVLGAQHPDVALALTNLGYIVRKQGRADEAEVILRDAIDAWRAAGGAHRFYLNALGHLAAILREQQRHDEAEPLLREALELQQQLVAPNDPTIGVAMGMLGDTLLALGNYDEAERLLLEFQKRSATAAPLQQRKAAERLARLYEGMNQPEQAAQWREQAAAIPVPATPPESR